MTRRSDVDYFWLSAPAGEERFDAEALRDRPDGVRHYLTHAIADGATLAAAVRLRMHGEIKLGGWRRFRAEQVIRRDRGMIWAATVRVMGLPVRGYDRLVDGAGAMRWWLLGLIPVVKASGPDVNRSAAGRLAAESVWLPSRLADPRRTWTALDPRHVHVGLGLAGERSVLDLSLGGDGRVEGLRLPRWGRPGGGRHRYEDFGGFVEQEGTFQAYTIPTRMRIGWFVGTDRFEPDGEFFRVVVEDAVYR